ncbi:MAG: hypothetical protein IKG85_04385 [Clostridia bacterium]|nr:hypothetical protein [Clostridia bacterium]
MRAIKWFFANFHRYLLWLLCSVILWGFVFTLITDAPKARKVVIYADTPSLMDAELADELGKDLPEGIRLIKVHPFSYAAFDTGAPAEADIYVLSREQAEMNAEFLSAVPVKDPHDPECEGRVIGWLIHSDPAGYSAADSFFGYYAQGETVSLDYVVCFNKNSVHIRSFTGTGDDAAVEIAERLLLLP